MMVVALVVVEFVISRLSPVTACLGRLVMWPVIRLVNLIISETVMLSILVRLIVASKDVATTTAVVASAMLRPAH